MNRSVGCLFLFLLSLIAGIIAGYFLIDLMCVGDDCPPLPTPPPPTSQVPPSTDPEQSILIIGVDDLLKPTPWMEGAWLVTMLDPGGGDIHLRLITLYPIVEASSTSTYHIPYAQPHQPIVIDPAKLDDLAFLEPISFSQDEWLEVIVLDEVAINTLILMQRLNISDPIPTPGPEDFDKPWVDPQTAFEQQDRILLTLCENPTPMSDPKNIEILVAMEGTHIQTTLPPGYLFSLWQLINFMPGRDVICTRIP